MTPSEKAMADTIDLLLADGFFPDGLTQQQTARLPTKRSPVLGNTGGELITLGGRLRFTKPGSNIKATVGRQTTALYRVEGPTGVQGISSHDTKAIEITRSVLQSL